MKAKSRIVLAIAGASALGALGFWFLEQSNGSGMAVPATREWHSNGVLKRVIHEEKSWGCCTRREWDENGALVRGESGTFRFFLCVSRPTDDEARAERVRPVEEIRAVCDALQAFRHAHDRWPEAADELVSSPTFREHVPGADVMPRDPWGHAYRFERLPDPDDPGALGHEMLGVYTLGRDDAAGGVGEDEGYFVGLFPGPISVR